MQRFDVNTLSVEVAASLRADGAVIVDNYVDLVVIESVLRDLRSEFDGEQGKSTQSDFNGYKTLRVNSVLDLSRDSVELVGHRRMMEVLDEILLLHCEQYQIGSMTAIEIYPGETDQTLHRDDTIYPVRLPMELQVSVMWPLTQFTSENGATRIVKGSHRWGGERTPGPGDQIEQAEMAPGSALFYLGSMYHGGGANYSRTARAGLINTYSLGWLRSEVNHQIMVPTEIARTYPPYIQALMGYAPHAGMLGWHSMPEWPGGDAE